jgi:hypothetical protein
MSLYLFGSPNGLTHDVTLLQFYAIPGVCPVSTQTSRLKSCSKIKWHVKTTRFISKKTMYAWRLLSSGLWCGVDTQLVRLRLKCVGTRAETRFRLSAKRTSPFKWAGASVQATTGSRGGRIRGSNAGYTELRGSVKGTDYPLHSPVSPSFPLPCVTGTFQLGSTKPRDVTTKEDWCSWTVTRGSNLP